MRNTAKKGMIIVLTLAFFACTMYRPQPAVNLNSLPQLRTQIDGKVRVSAAVLTAEESGKFFGVAVYNSGVQPVLA